MKKTIVNFILDKSGSMSSVRDATISGVNEYVQTLKNDKKSAYSFSLTVFDTESKELHKNKPLAKVEKLTKEDYEPGGNTALYDAVCSSIKSLKSEVGKSDKVLCVIMTDGEENSSKEYTQEQLKTLIKELEAEGNWTFVFLGANQDAWANAQKFGFHAQNVATFNSTEKGINNVFTMMASNTSAFSMRSVSNTDSFLSKEDQDNLKNTL